MLTILATSFLFNIIPFAGPSNLLIASNAAILTDVAPYIVGIAVAFGSATAKFIHYLATFFLGKYIGKERRKRLDATGAKIRKWAMLALFTVAATPIPDEPIIIPLGLLRYNPGKLFLAYLSGKLVIGIIGAYLGIFAHRMFAPLFGSIVFIILSIVATIVITIVLLKIDVMDLAEKILKRKTKINPE